MNKCQPPPQLLKCLISGGCAYPPKVCRTKTTATAKVQVGGRESLSHHPWDEIAIGQPLGACTHTYHIPLGRKEARGRDPLEKVSFITQPLWACHRMVSGEYRLVVFSRDAYPSKRLWVTDFVMCCFPWDAPAWRISPRCYCSAGSREEGIDMQRGKSSFLSESPSRLKGWSLCRLHFVGGTDTTCHRWALSLSLGPERH